ncbi:hypothetical protein HKD37_13G036902 [Glycine soja]
MRHVDFIVTHSPRLRPSPRRKPVHRTQTGRSRCTRNRFFKRRVVSAPCAASGASPRFLT